MCELELMYYYRQKPTPGFAKVQQVYEKLVYKAINQKIYDFGRWCFTLQDCLQEALMTLGNSLKCYRLDRQALFSTYLFTCISTTVSSMIRQHCSLSFGLLDRSISLSKLVGPNLDYEIQESLVTSSTWHQPHQMAHSYELLVAITHELKQLTHQEWNVFHLRNDGLNYSEIAEITNLSSKKIDNMLYKIRSDLKVVIKQFKD